MIDRHTLRSVADEGRKSHVNRIVIFERMQDKLIVEIYGRLIGWNHIYCFVETSDSFVYSMPFRECRFATPAEYNRYHKQQSIKRMASVA